MSALSDWLDTRGLGALRVLLEAQQIDIDVLPDLTEDDLKGIGIALGPRRLHIPTWHAALGDGLLAARAADEERETIDRALALAAERKESFAVPVLLRLRGLVADRQGDGAAARSGLEQAIRKARERIAGGAATGVCLDACRRSRGGAPDPRRGMRWTRRRGVDRVRDGSPRAPFVVGIAHPKSRYD